MSQVIENILKPKTTENARELIKKNTSELFKAIPEDSATLTKTTPRLDILKYLQDYVITNDAGLINAAKLAVKKKTLWKMEDLNLLVKQIQTDLKKNTKNTPIELDPLPLLDPTVIDVYLKGCRSFPLVWLYNLVDLVHGGDKKSGVLGACAWVSQYFGEFPQIAFRGESGGGKSHLATVILNLVDPKRIVQVARCTGPALEHIVSESSTYTGLYFNEYGATSKEDDVANNIRKMLSGDDTAGRIIKMEKEGERWVPVEIQPRNFATLTTYAKDYIEKEESTRLLMIQIDESKDHRKEIISKYLLASKRELNRKKKTYESYLQAWQQGITPLLDKCDFDVEIPYLEVVEGLFKGQYEARVMRDIKRFRKLIEILTKIHYSLDNDSRHKIVEDEIVYLIAEPQDYSLAFDISYNTTQQNIQGLNDAEVKILKVINEIIQEKELEPKKELSQQTLDKTKENSFLTDLFEREITVKPAEVIAKVGLCRGTVRKYMNTLRKNHFIRPANMKEGGKRIYEYALDDTPGEIKGEEVKNIEEVKKLTKDFLGTQGIEKEFSLIYSMTDKIPDLITKKKTIDLKDMDPYQERDVVVRKDQN